MSVVYHCAAADFTFVCPRVLGTSNQIVIIDACKLCKHWHNGKICIHLFSSVVNWMTDVVSLSQLVIYIVCGDTDEAARTERNIFKKVSGVLENTASIQKVVWRLQWRSWLHVGMQLWASGVDKHSDSKCTGWSIGTCWLRGHCP